MSDVQTTHPLLTERDTIISAYSAHESAVKAGRTPKDSDGATEHYAVQAGRSRQIRALQVRMLLAGLAPTVRDSDGKVSEQGDFDEWSPVRKIKPTVSQEDLFTEIKRLHSAVSKGALQVNGRTVKLTSDMISAFETQCDARVLSALKRDDISDEEIPVPATFRNRVQRDATERAAKRSAKDSAKDSE